MSGIRPDGTAIYNFQNHIREPGQPKIITTPQQFKQFGYTVLGGGKTFHYDRPPHFDDTGESGSWSSEMRPYYPFREFVGSFDMTSPLGRPTNHLCPNGASACKVNGSMEQFYDYRLANATIEALHFVKSVGKPFYVMAGFRRPHRDFYVHERFWDMYPDEEAIEVCSAMLCM